LIPNLLIFFTFYFDIQDGFWYEASAYDAYRSENKVGVPSGVFSILAL